MTRIDALLVLMVLIWGPNFSVIRRAFEEIDPQPFNALRMVIASIVFAGAPIVNAVVAMMQHPPAGGIAAIKWPFYLGLVLAAVGGSLVTLYRPLPAPAHKPAPTTAGAPETPPASPVVTAEAKSP